jgi:uncharacterized membrane protein
MSDFIGFCVIAALTIYVVIIAWAMIPMFLLGLLFLWLMFYGAAKYEQGQEIIREALKK